MWPLRPKAQPLECFVRIYVVRCFGLEAKDNNGRSDPYITISCGKRKIADDHKEHIKATLNPIFGRFVSPACNPFLSSPNKSSHLSPSAIARCLQMLRV